MQSGRRLTVYVFLYAVFLGASCAGLWSLTSSDTLRLPVWLLITVSLALAFLSDLAAQILTCRLDRPRCTRRRGHARPTASRRNP
jgi:hypothetical protein